MVGLSFEKYKSKHSQFKISPRLAVEMDLAFSLKSTTMGESKYSDSFMYEAAREQVRLFNIIAVSKLSGDETSLLTMCLQNS